MNSARTMKIMMASTSYPKSESDWKGLFIRNMLEALGEKQKIELSIWQPPGPIPATVRSTMTVEDEKWLDHLMESGGISHQLRTKPLAGLFSSMQLLFRLNRAFKVNTSTDVRHVNWLQNALAVPNDRTPLVASALGTDMALLQKPGVQKVLHRAFSRQPSVICPNASWMIPELEQRFGDAAKIEYVPFGIGTEWYEVQRNPQMQNLWLCISRVTPKKIGTLFEWSQNFFDKSQHELHLFGPNQADMKIPKWIHYHGSETPENLRRKWFPRATGLISLSQHSEGRPQAMLEAMASGIPILASDIVAHRDIIKHRKNGWICECADSLKQGLRYIAKPKENENFGKAARLSVKSSSGTWATYADRLAKVYESLLEKPW